LHSGSGGRLHFTASDPGLKGPGNKRGEGSVEGWTFYQCKGPVCEVGSETIEMYPLGQASNPVTKTKETVGRITTPWEANIQEPKAKEWQLHIGNKLKNEKAIRFAAGCPALTLTAHYGGELNPVGETGTLIGASPAILTFKGAESGVLEWEGSTETSTVKGKVKLMGYSEQHDLEVVNQ
jgi:hypothetical protein